MNYRELALSLHAQAKGKITIESKLPISTVEDLAKVYSPGVAAPCEVIADNPDAVWKYTIKGNTVAIVTDGSAVLGLGNIGAEASIPVMEGKAMLFKEFADINAFPIALATQDPDEIVHTVRQIAPVFGGINLEDIAAPRCFEVEDRLQDLGIPVFHDDQHGTAVVALAALINAAKVVGKSMSQMKVVINGAGAAGMAIAKLLTCQGYAQADCHAVAEVLLCDSKGLIHAGRTNLNPHKQAALSFTNPKGLSGDVFKAIEGADVFIGVSKGNLLTAQDIKHMAQDPIIFALANPTPEIMPAEAYAGGAAVVGTGRSDLPNQINNVLGFPGIFRGALDARATQITPAMKLAAANAIAAKVSNPSPEVVIPPVLDPSVAAAVAEAVKEAVKR